MFFFLFKYTTYSFTMYAIDMHICSQRKIFVFHKIVTSVPIRALEVKQAALSGNYVRQTDRPRDGHAFHRLRTTLLTFCGDL